MQLRRRGDSIEFESPESRSVNTYLRTLLGIFEMRRARVEEEDILILDDEDDNV